MTPLDPKAILDQLIAAERGVRPPAGAHEASWELLRPRIIEAAGTPAVATAATTSGLTKLLGVSLGLGLIAAVGLALMPADPGPDDITSAASTIPQATPLDGPADGAPTPTPPVPQDISAPVEPARPVISDFTRSDPEDSSWSAELAALQQVHAALREGRPADALALVDEHTRRWPSGEFREQIDAARVLALCAQGPGAAARRALATFRRRWPTSLYTARVRQSCSP